jgi:glycosyltransferase involved in cell wall biosynthesis
VAAVLPESCTLIAPHQRASSGGVHVLEQLACHLADSMQVNLAVRRGPLRALAGVNVLEAPSLDAQELPDARVLIGGLAQPDPERVLALPPGKGAPLFVFQGYGSVGNPRVSAMLERRPRVLAVSSFLVERARASGCPAELTRPGLDRTTFFAGPPCEEREPVVAMMTHANAFKAMDDGLETLARVHAAVPAAKLVLFGGEQPPPGRLPATASFLGELSREQVGTLLRRASVFVCPSLEEGLGLPGIEALACGAALASTDTRGSRDYALHEQTALVTAPGEPLALADSVVRLLREDELRGRLSVRGLEHVLATYPPWPQAAARFSKAIAELLLSQEQPTAQASR